MIIKPCYICDEETKINKNGLCAVCQGKAIQERKRIKENYKALQKCVRLKQLKALIN